jgi:glycine amidinotransferase
MPFRRTTMHTPLQTQSLTYPNLFSLAMPSATPNSVQADDEWSKLSSIIVGRAAYSCFPSEPRHMIEATMPEHSWEQFRPNRRFPEEISKEADKELDGLAAMLESEGIRVFRPAIVDWHKVGGYTAAMPRDGLMTVGNTLIEAPFSWQCRKHEIELAYSEVLARLAREGNCTIVRAPTNHEHDTIYDGVLAGKDAWAVNDARPAFDAADFMRFGKVLIGQYSNVTNQKGIEYLRACIPDGYSVEMLDSKCTSIGNWALIIDRPIS